MTRTASEAPKTLSRKLVEAVPTAASKPAIEPLLPVVAVATETVDAVVDTSIETVEATAGTVPGLTPTVRGVTSLVDEVVEALPVVGAEPVVELPLPGVPAEGLPSPSLSTTPAVPGAHDDTVGATTRSPTDAPSPSSAAARGVVDVTADRELVGPSAGPGVDTALAVAPPSERVAGAGQERPGPAETPVPVAPMPAPSGAGSVMQSPGQDAQSDLPFATAFAATASAAIDSTGRRALGAPSAQPGLRPD